MLTVQKGAHTGGAELTQRYSIDLQRACPLLRLTRTRAIWYVPDLPCALSTSNVILFAPQPQELSEPITVALDLYVGCWHGGSRRVG